MCSVAKPQWSADSLPPREKFLGPVKMQETVSNILLITRLNNICLPIFFAQKDVIELFSVIPMDFEISTSLKHLECNNVLTTCS